MCWFALWFKIGLRSSLPVFLLSRATGSPAVRVTPRSQTHPKVSLHLLLAFYQPGQNANSRAVAPDLCKGLFQGALFHLAPEFLIAGWNQSLQVSPASHLVPAQALRAAASWQPGRHLPLKAQTPFRKKLAAFQALCLRLWIRLIMTKLFGLWYKIYFKKSL